MSRVGLALDNLRGFVILMVLAFHSFMAYMASQPLSPSPFDASPYNWQAHPIIDSDRWWGFDLFGAFQFLHLMQLMFFLSGLFIWPSLHAQGGSQYSSVTVSCGSAAVRRGRIFADASGVFSSLPRKLGRPELVRVLVAVDCIAVLAERADLVPVVYTRAKRRGRRPLLARSAFGRTSRPALGLRRQPS